MYASLRLIFTCSLFALPLVACGDDGNATDANATPGTTTDDTTTGTATDTLGTTTGTEATTDEPTTGEPTTTTETSTSPGTTTEEPGTTTTEPGTTTTEPGTSTEPETTTTTTTTTGDGLSWETDVFPAAIEGKCGCHQQGSGGLTITGSQDAYQNLVDVDATQAAGFKRVAPGDAANSYLLAKLKGTAGEGPFNGNPSQMPKGGGPLPADTIALVEQWINEGAAP
ncbi:hypothetical protein OV203_10330 [Nannocystis sp. ILAH1]|uniref:hypothetical protein n=1 Tax=unclassified Nannocystis TaxID=2627009 RepID=UPI00227087CA|nr:MULTISPECIES: hypothetical protein [unclassified Nannocystis]MCY0987521.1 hypothetical protein [Nannocystis sp. ILAH1]MCY1070684.1 hypothetical protein [Nannocystis sp. RBIL2]